MADFPKKQQQCLIPKYLLDYLGQLDENHPDPSAEWGGQGTTYTAGDGIIIDDDTISVDDETVAMVSNLSTVAFSGSYLNLSDKPDLSVYELKENAFKVLDFTSYAGAQTSQELWEALEDTWPRVIIKYYDDYFVPQTDSQHVSDYRLTCIHATHLIDIQTQKETYEISVKNLQINEYSAFQDMPITVTNDYDDLVNQPTIPVVPTNVSAFTNDADYATETYVDTAAANSFKVLDFTQFSGQPALFAELEEAWPKVFILYHGYMYMPMTFEEVEPSYTFIHVDGQYNPIDPQNPANDINLNRIQINRYYVMQYNCIISNDYNDLINKPTMPAAVSGTNDGTNWTTITIGTDTYNIPAGGGSSYTAGTGIDITNNTISVDNTVAMKTDIPTVPTNVSSFTNDAGYITSSDLPTNHVTTNTVQTITGNKTFSGTTTFSNATNKFTARNPIQLVAPNNQTTGFTLFNSNNQEKGYLQYNSTQDGLYLGRWGNNAVAEFGFLSESSTNRGYKVLVPNLTSTVAPSNNVNYITLSVNGTKADSSGNISLAIPTVPTNVSAFTNDAGYLTSSDLPTNHVTTDTTQTITGIKTFSGTGNLIKMKNTGSAAGNGIMFQDNNNNNIGYFEFRTDDKVLKFGVNTTWGPGYKVGLQSFGSRTYTAYLPDNADKYTAIGAGDVYLPLSVNGNTASVGGDITLSATSTSTVTPTTTQLVFTYNDNTTETVTLMTGASVSTTTTLS